MIKKDKKGNTKAKEDSLLKGRNKNMNLNLYIVDNLKIQLGINTLKEVHISNLLNLKIKDIDEIELGQRELSLKDLNLICDRFGIDPDNLFNGFNKVNKLD